jgi:hypothetical protein
MSKEGVPLNSLYPVRRVFMLMSLPNSVGIDPAAQLRTCLKQVVDSYYHTRLNEKTGLTGQINPGEIKGSHVDEHAEFRGDRPCQRK